MHSFLLIEKYMYIIENSPVLTAKSSRCLKIQLLKKESSQIGDWNLENIQSAFYDITVNPIELNQNTMVSYFLQIYGY